MFFAMNTFLWTDRFDAIHLHLVSHVAELGADAIEIQRSGFTDFPVEDLRRELERTRLPCTLSTSPPQPDQCLVAADAVHRRAGLAYLREAIAVARDLGARLLVGPLYAPPWWFTGTRPTAEQRAWAAEGFHALGPDLERADIHLAIEPMNRFETFFLTTAEEGVAFCELIGHPRIGLLLDTAHMVIEEKDPLAAIRRARPWLKHLQLPEADRGAPGSGRSINWEGLFRTLREIDYAGGCSLESFPYWKPELAMKTRSWRDLASSPDELARQGLAFLKQAYRNSMKASRRPR